MLSKQKGFVEIVIILNRSKNYVDVCEYVLYILYTINVRITYVSFNYPDYIYSQIIFSNHLWIVDLKILTIEFFI